MIIAQAIRAATEDLAATSDTARLDAELLMAYALDISRSDLLLRMGRDNWDVPQAFHEFIERRAASEPIAYILGQQEFYGRSFRVNPDVLIPRSDSETLIEAALEAAPNAERVLDLGTGSGALLITALLELKNAKGVGADQSRPAIDVASENACRHGLDQERAQLLRRDWCETGWADGFGTFDLILCNPPYVEDDAQLDRDVRDYEPASALFAGADGLDDYRILIPQLGKLMNTGAVAIFEIGTSQAKEVSTLAKVAGFEAETRLDLANRPRAVVLR